MSLARPQLEIEATNDLIVKDLGLQLGQNRGTQQGEGEGDGGQGGSGPAVATGVTGLACSAFWDVENCPIPSNYFMPRHLAPNILKVLKASGLPCEDVLDMHVYYDSTTNSSATSRKIKEIAGASNGVGIKLPVICDIKGGKSNKDAGDKAMVADIYGWISKHPAPANVLIISADGDFCRVTNSLRQKLYNLVVACTYNVTPAGNLLRAPLGVFKWKAMAAGTLAYYSPCHVLQPQPQPPHRDDEDDNPPFKVHIWWDHQTCPLPAEKKDLMKTVSHAVKTNLRDRMGCWGPIEVEVYVDAEALDPVVPLDFISHDVRFSIVPRGPVDKKDPTKYKGKEDASKMILHDMLGAMLKTGGESHWYVVVSDADVSSALGCVKKCSKHTPVVVKSPGVDFDYARQGVNVWDWPTAVFGA